MANNFSANLKKKGVFLMKKVVSMLMVLVMALSLMGCGAKRTMKLATTTSTADTGLLDYLLPLFEKDTGIKVDYLSKGTGEAIKLGQNGDVDCLLVHAKAQEEQFVKDGYGVERFEVMYNDFIIVGPKDDPAKLKEKAQSDPVQAFKLIAESKSKFISRGDESGTHTKEKGLWKEAGITPSGDWYVSAGKGMGDVLKMADEMKAYTLSDRGTYLAYKSKVELDIVTEKSPELYNQYGVIAVNPEKFKNVKSKEADEFIKWILSDKGQKLIGEFGKDKYGEPLFIANAKK